jgi:general secretion pathway protein E
MRMAQETHPVKADATMTGAGTTGTGTEHERLGALLVAQGHCDTKTLERARSVAAESGQRIDSVLIQLGLVSERDLAEALAALLAVPLVAADGYPIEPLLTERLGAKFLRQARAVPLAVRGSTLRLAMANPLDRFTPTAVAAATGLAVALEVAVPIELEAALGRLYPDLAATEADATPQEAGDWLAEDTERLKDLASEAPVIRLVNQLIARAVETQASDIHIEPFEDRLRVRYRYDGVLHEAENPPARLASAITSRIKIMSRLDIAERRLPQDGRIRLAVRGQDVDFRVSTIPSLHGETVVLRILDRNAVVFDYDRLGLPPGIVRQMEASFALPNGIVLVTGPTGSGKTTTLYTGLLGLNSVARNIVTIEDPIEYQLAGIAQIQVKPQIQLTFANLLRSILRQDPDVIMVGEIRDLETARIAAQASLTGHLLLSTLHTNDAVGALIRLVDMGLEEYLIAAVLKGVLAQRLVRCLCPACRQPYRPEPELLRHPRLAALADRDFMLYRPSGCEACGGSGYRGRTAIAELLVFDERLSRCVIAGADGGALIAEAQAGGFVDLHSDGLAKAAAGITSLDEVLRVTGAG